MDQQQNFSEENQIPEPQPYVPRPRWQVWLARISLVIFLLILLFYYLNIMRGGI